VKLISDISVPDEVVDGKGNFKAHHQGGNGCHNDGERQGVSSEDQSVSGEDPSENRSFSGEDPIKGRSFSSKEPRFSYEDVHNDNSGTFDHRPTTVDELCTTQPTIGHTNKDTHL